ncbi:MAG: RNA-binding protein [Elusimicrobiota bacterium]|jgi:RNA recognition motif-containing protein
MRNTLRSKTLTASLPHDVQALFAKIADPDSLPQWHPNACRSIRRENGQILAESPRGPMGIRLIRDDRALLVDLIMCLSEGIEFTTSIRLLQNGSGSEIIMTMIQPQGLSDSTFNEQVHWAENALRGLRKTALPHAALEPILPLRQATEAPSSPAPAAPAADNPKIPFSSRKIFVGNLPFDWAEEPLRALFADSGQVTAVAIARFRGRGRSRGFGFIEMSTEAEAQAAIEKLHGSLAGNRKIVVRLSRMKENSTVETPVARASDLTSSPSESTPSSEPGNTLVPEPSSASQPKPHRPTHPQRVHRPQNSRRSRIPRPGRSRPEIGIVNSGGYEIFPRRAKGSTELPPAESSRTYSSQSSIEPSPYFEDTGDIENKGNRPPRRRHR